MDSGNVFSVRRTGIGISFDGFDGFLSRGEAVNLARHLIATADPTLALWLSSVKVDCRYLPAHEFRREFRLMATSVAANAPAGRLEI